LFALIAELFAPFLIISSPVDERSLRSRLRCTNTELVRFAATEQDIHHVVSAGEGQTAPDAIAQLVLANGD
jgi:hypothetical protein